MTRRHEKPDREDARAAGGPGIRVVQGFASLRAERVWAEADDCAACQQARTETSDSEALCDRHMGEALGMNSDWP